MQFIVGFEAAIVWVGYVLGAAAAIGVGVAILATVIVVLAAGFDVASDVVAALWHKLRKGRHGKE
ncbi:MAG: hypothetical protein RR998_08405 [Oscillospiraceae bacterium]